MHFYFLMWEYIYVYDIRYAANIQIPNNCIRNDAQGSKSQKKKGKGRTQANVPVYKYLNGKKLILVRYILVVSISGKTQKQSKKNNCIDIGGGGGSRFLKGPKKKTSCPPNVP